MMRAGVLRSLNSMQPAKIIALISGVNLRRAKGKDAIAQLSMEQLMILVSQSFESTSEELKIVQFESSQLLKYWAGDGWSVDLKILEGTRYECGVPDRCTLNRRVLDSWELWSGHDVVKNVDDFGTVDDLMQVWWSPRRILEDVELNCIGEARKSKVSFVSECVMS